jgi:hypothetical protein
MDGNMDVDIFLFPENTTSRFLVGFAGADSGKKYDFWA